jgi:hypothetical protein
MRINEELERNSLAPQPGFSSCIPGVVYKTKACQCPSNERFWTVAGGIRRRLACGKSVIAKNQERIEGWLVRGQTKGNELCTDGVEQVRREFKLFVDRRRHVG